MVGFTACPEPKCEILGEDVAAGAGAKPDDFREHPTEAQAGYAAPGEHTQVIHVMLMQIK